MRIAIMQPYFIPYAGYFRLFSSTDLFVVYDCVQFIRRGWIHRNQLPRENGELTWLTLPLVKAPQETIISGLGFATDATDRMQEQMGKFPLFSTAAYRDSEFHPLLTAFTQSPVTYVINLLKTTCRLLNLPCNIACSSELNLASDIRGQERILAIAKHFQAKTYINAPGGTNLYDTAVFNQNGIELQFLSSYQGPTQSILSRLINENNIALRKEIISQSIGML